MIDKDKIRARFKYYRQRIAELQQELESANCYHEESISRMERHASSCENERVERERQAEFDRWYREEELRKATSNLERAVGYGDEYAIRRATEKIKRLNY